MTWVLIISIFYDGGLGIEHVEFKGKEACLSAAKSITDNSNLRGTVAITCVPRGN